MRSDIRRRRAEEKANILRHLKQAKRKERWGRFYGAQCVYGKARSKRRGENSIATKTVEKEHKKPKKGEGDVG